MVSAKALAIPFRESDNSQNGCRFGATFKVNKFSRAVFARPPVVNSANPDHETTPRLRRTEDKALTNRPPRLTYGEHHSLYITCSAALRVITL